LLPDQEGGRQIHPGGALRSEGKIHVDLHPVKVCSWLACNMRWLASGWLA